MGWVAGEQCIVFYANNGRMEGRNYIWIHGALSTLVQRFEWVEMYMNLGNTKSMKYTPRFIWGKLRKDSYKRW